MKRRKPSERALPAGLPEGDTGRLLKPGERVRVDEDTAFEEVGDRGAVQAGARRKGEDRQATIIEDSTQSTSAGSELGDAGWCALADAPRQEVSDDVVARASRGPGAARHELPSHQVDAAICAIPVANTCSTVQTVGSNPQSGRETFEMAVQKEAGSRVHLLIATAVEAGGDLDMVVLTKAMWKLAPVGGTIRSGVRVSCASKASMYLSRIRPGADWELVGAEVPVGRGVADLVWRHTASGDVFIEEIKSGGARIGDAKVTDQVIRLYAGGVDKWGSSFIGVRLVALTAPALTALYIHSGSRLVPVADARLAVR